MPIRPRMVTSPGRIQAPSPTPVGTDVHVLRRLNPQLIRDVTPPREIYGVRIPVGGGARVVEALARRVGTTAQRADD